MNTFFSVNLQLLKGFSATIQIFVITLLIALPAGFIIAFGSMSHFYPLRKAVRMLVWVVRGTPLMLQLIIMYNGPGLLFGTPIFKEHTATFITFGLNYACYFSEIYRGGIESIAQGQYEAGQVLAKRFSTSFSCRW